jgi:hypothetical protein
VCYIKIERSMEHHYGTAQFVSAIPAGEVKDLYWRTWKANLIIELEILADKLNISVTSLGLRVSVCHSRDRIGATFYIESSHCGRKWEPPTRKREPISFADPPPPLSGHVMWNESDISPANAYRLQQIVQSEIVSIGGGLTPCTVLMTPATDKNIPSTATSVPLCLLSMLKLSLTTWFTLPEGLPRKYGTTNLPYVNMHRYG